MAHPREPVAWVSSHAKPIIFGIIVLSIIGVYSATQIPIAVFPETNFPRVVIAIDNGVMPIEQMQVMITRPVEEAMSAIPGMQSVRSITSRGSGEVDVFFDWNVDMILTLQYVQAALARVQPSLPPTVKIDAHRLTFASFPILGYSLTSKTVPQTDLWDLANYTIKPRISHLDGVSTVVIQGGQVPEYRIAPDPARLLITGITVQDILDSVARTNMIDSPGLLQQNHQLVLGLVSGQVQSAAQLTQVVVKTTQAGAPVRIGDVAQVTPSVEPVYTIVHANGLPAVLININRQPTGNTVAVADEVAQEMADIEKSLPPGIKIEPFYDQSGLVRARIKSVRDAIIIGIILASVVLIAFLHDWGSSLIAGLVIPITIAVTFIAIRLMGETFNLMTLGGLAAAVGLVIDDAIVMVENIVLHRDTGQDRTTAVRSALREITKPLIGSTVTPIVVFVPLITIAGVTGVFFSALAITMTVALATSLLLALTWTPTLSGILVRRNAPDKHLLPPKDSAEELQRLLAAEDATMSGRFGRVIAWYEHVLERVIRHPIWLVGGCVALIAVSYFCYKALGTDLLPEMEEGGFVLDYWAPAGSSLDETNRMLEHVETILKSNPDVVNTSRRTGLELGLAAVTEANRGDFTVKLKPGAKFDEVTSKLREQINREEPALKVDFVQILSDMVGDLSNEPEPVRINLFSQNAQELGDVAPRVADAIRKVNGVVDVLNGIENTISGPAVTYQVDPTVATRSGFSAQEVATDAAALVAGVPASAPMVVKNRPYTVRVRFPGAESQNAADLGSTLINSVSGHTATLASLAAIESNPGEREIRRENLQQYVSVTSRLEGVDLGTAIANVQRAVSNLHLPGDVRVQYGGTYREQQQSFHDLSKVLILALLLVFTVLLFEFRAFAAPVAIIASAALSTSGVVIALLITNTGFNIASFMGLIMVIGIVAKNGILLLDAESRFIALGMPPREALIQSGRRRLRPIVMTAMAAVAGMFPLALGLGSGSEMLQPLAIAVIGGILISMALSLVVTPAVHYYLSSSRRKPGAGDSRTLGG